MPTASGRFVWYELMTTDLDAATSFYGEVIGWSGKDAGFPDRRYTLVSASGSPTAGLMAIPPEAAATGMPPHWLSYIGVDDVDGFAARVAQAGGAVHHAPEDIPQVGRIAVVGDPQGAVFGLFRGKDGSAGPPMSLAASGHVGWHELHASDGASALPFYENLFGWLPASSVDMGPMGKYQTFNIGEDWAGGVMTKLPYVPRPFWLYYFRVDSVTALVPRIEGAGGKILNGPQEVPGGGFIINALDPQGAVFALLSAGA